MLLILLIGCNRARFSEFRGEKLQTRGNGRVVAEKHCGTCHLTPSPESMTQPTANYMLAYMGLFLGIDASRTLDDAERMHFKIRFEMLKRSGAIPARAAMVSDDWQALRGYYLSLARYPFESGEKTEPLPVRPIALGDQGVTLLKRLTDGRIAVGGGMSGNLFFFKSDLTAEYSIRLDSPPVHIVERDGGYYVLTIGSILGREEDRSSLYFIAKGARTAKRLIGDLPRSAHFLAVDANRDGRISFDEFVADAKRKPGTYNYGSSGNYGTMHVPMEMLKASAGFRMTHIPYTGAGPALLALLSGQVDAVASGPSTVAQQIKSGKLRALAHWGEHPLASMPDVPGLKQSGLGREKSRLGIEAYLETKTVYLSYAVPDLEH